MKSLFQVCPNGCHSKLTRSNIIVVEGELKECTSCGQLVSSCSQEYFEKSNEDWNTEEGTWPTEKDYLRLFKRRKKDLIYIAKLLSKNKSDIRVLDVGCSNGSGVHIANSIGVQSEGIDPSEKAISNGKKRGLKLHLGYLNEGGFESNSFDALTMYEIIEHVSNPNALLKECARILKPNGILLIATGNTDSWTRRVRKNKWDFFDMKHHGGHISFFTPNSLSKLAAQSGFGVVKVITHSVKFCEKKELSPVLYRSVKLFTELLNLPARLFNKGHQMEVFLKINKS